MGYIEQTEIIKEYTNFLRNSDILTTTVRGVTTASQNFTTTLTGVETFTLTNASTCKNIRSVVYDGTTLAYKTDYTINIDTGQVTILSVVPTKTVTIQYDYGSDKIFDDYPRQDLTLASYPRIGYGIYGFASKVAGFGNVISSTWRFDIRVYATSKTQADELIDLIRKKNIDAFNSFYAISRVYPGNVLDLGIYETDKGRNKIYVKGIDIIAIENYEIN